MENVLILEEKKSIVINKDITIALVKSFGLISLKICLVGLLGTNIYTTLNEYKSSQIIPVKIEKVDELKRIKESLVILNCPPEKIQPLAESIHTGAKVAQVDPVLIAVLMATESEFSLTAKSKMGYKGLMQTPTSTKIAVVDTVHGAAILKDKLRIAKNDLLLGLTFYKGSSYTVKNGKKSDGYKQAQQVVATYNKVIDKMKTV